MNNIQKTYYTLIRNSKNISFIVGVLWAINKNTQNYVSAHKKEKPSMPVASRVHHLNNASNIDQVPIGELVFYTYPIQSLSVHRSELMHDRLVLRR